MMIEHITKRLRRRKTENERLELLAELQKTKRLIKAAEYSFDMALEKEDIDRSISVLADLQRKYSKIYSELRNLTYSNE